MSTLSVLAVSDVCKNIHLCVTLAIRLLSCMHRDKEVVKTFIDKKIVSLTGVDASILCAMTNKREEDLFLALETSGGDSGASVARGRLRACMCARRAWLSLSSHVDGHATSTTMSTATLTAMSC